MTRSSHRSGVSVALLFSLLCAAPAFAEAPGTATVTVRLLALGDSFTAGTGSPADRSFPERWAERLRSVGRVVVLRNLGVNGYTTDALIDDELPAARGFAPTVVTLAIGANDIVHGSKSDRYRARVRTILRALLDDGVAAAAIVALPQPDWSRSPVAAAFGSQAELGSLIRLFNHVLREEAEAVGARYLDLSPLMEKQAAAAGMIADDGLHPSARAYDEWAAVLFERIKVGRSAAR